MNPSPADRPLRVLLAASEVVGFAKTGGLADVAGSLPRALAKRGVEIAVVLPLYRTVATGRVSARSRRAGASARSAPLRTPITAHTIAYEGHSPPLIMALTGLDAQLFNYQQLEFYGQLNFLKAGIVFADAISTVSPRYAQEIQTMVFGYGLEGVLSERKARLTGIVNGVDYREWDPAHDRHIAATYDPDTVFERKPLCKAAIQREYHLPE